MQGTWEAKVTRVNGEKFTCTLPNNRPPVKGEKVKCHIGDETVWVRVVNDARWRTPNERGLGFWTFDAEEIACPICGSEAKTLDRTGDAVGFDCPQHGKFKVACTVFASEPTRIAGRDKWEAALKTAAGRSNPDEWPCITTHDF
jgi:hypothetical protein